MREIPNIQRLRLSYGFCTTFPMELKLHASLLLTSNFENHKKTVKKTVHNWGQQRKRNVLRLIQFVATDRRLHF